MNNNKETNMDESAKSPISKRPRGRRPDSANTEFEKDLSPSFTKINFDDANRKSDSDLSTHEGCIGITSPSSKSNTPSSASPSGSSSPVDDKYINFAISHDGQEQDDEVDVMIADCDHELGLDNDGEKLRCLEGVVKNANTLLDFVQGEFAQTYNRRANSNDEERKDMKGFITKIVELIEFVKDLDISVYDSGRQLEDELNKRRDDIGKAMVEALKNNGHNDLISRINLGSRFSLDTLIVFYLHYAPIGCKPVDGDKWNYCRPDQCCIHTMMRKLPNFLINEEKHGSEKMQEWAFGGGHVEDKSNHIAAIDLIPFLLEKKDNDKEMREQYEDVARKFGLGSFYDLMIIPFCSLQMHVKLFEKRQAEKEEASKQKLQIHSCSSATSKYIHGFVNGIKKYLQTYQTSSFQQTFGIHPQCWLMGTHKNRSAFPKELIEVMTRNLVLVYSVLHYFGHNFQSQIMDIFGGKCGGIDVGMYNHLAKILRKKNLLNLDADARESGEEVETFVKTTLSKHGISPVIILFIVNETKADDIQRFMERVRKCSAAHRMPFIASQISSNDEFSKLSGSLQSIIEALSTPLGQDCNEVFKKLQNIKRSQDSNGLRLGLQQQLAALFRSAGDEASGRVAVVRHSDFAKFRTLSRLDEDAAIESVKAASQNLDSLAIRHRLAKVYNNAESKQDGCGINAVQCDGDFEEFRKVSGLSPEKAIARVVEIASGYCNTFWSNLNDLKVYRDTYAYDVMIVDGKCTLTVDEHRSGRKYSYLNRWMLSMNGYSKKFEENEQEYGIKAYQQMGTLEQIALAELDVCFDPDTMKKAMEKRTRERLIENHDKDDSKSELLSFDWE